MNICGCLVHLSEIAPEDTRTRIEDMDGVEIHAASGDGRLVVVVEDTASASASESIMAIHQIPGVISVTLNYHHFEDQPSPVAKAT